jgi:hypothetical protein
MRLMRWSAGLLLAGLPLAGCDKPKSQPQPPVTRTTTRPADIAAEGPATAPASRPTTSKLWVSGQEYVFPRARLVVQQAQPNLSMLLFSDDPREAIKPDYRGNRYYLEIKLDVDDVEHIPSTNWHYKAASGERVDSPVGIFLDGDTHQLQPYEVDIAFGGTASQITVSLSGHFLMFPMRDEGAVPKAVSVQGTLTAELETRQKTRKPEAMKGPAEGK